MITSTKAKRPTPPSPPTALGLAAMHNAIMTAKADPILATSASNALLSLRSAMAALGLHSTPADDANSCSIPEALAHIVAAAGTIKLAQRNESACTTLATTYRAAKISLRNLGIDC